MDIQKVKQLLSREENEKLDFKAELHLLTESDKKELVKDVTAMANTRGGRGHILFGVEDKTKRILGVDPTQFHEEQIQQIIYNRSDPPVPVNLDLVQIEDKTIAVLTIFRSHHAPHQIIQTGAFYVRRGSTTDFARRSELASMMQENGLMTFETVIVKNATLDDFDFERMNQFFKTMAVTTDSPQTMLMEAFGFISDKGGGDYAPTVGGLLLFGKNPQIYLPQCHIRISWGENTEILNGCLLAMLDKASERIQELLMHKAYPYEALEEAIANALVHRDYLDLSRGVNITVTAKTIEIDNPGAVTEGSKVYSNLKECFPERRNAWLYQRLLSIDPKRRFLKSGLGLNRIRKAFSGIGPVKFVNLGKQNNFKVILPRGV
ncbi:MAG: putative DNA binding domain-containing protein [Clostridia bacterium]|nr:putative DNA binding domain-containing protein [Clostridia bacterium]